MADPTTANIALNVPVTGSNVGTWGDVSINPDMVAIDGMFGGVATISLSNVPVTLTKPSAVIVPSAGPTQAQNAVLQFTGTLSANVVVTLPLPGIQTIANFTTGNFVVSFRAVGSGAVIAVPQGTVMRIYNDGTNVYFLNDTGSFPSQMIFLSGVSTVPAWITACTKRPFLLQDGSVYNVSDYPELGGIYGSRFGGNGITTFGVMDMRGRYPIAYDGTGTRITTAGCGIDGQTLGAAGGGQNQALVQANLPDLTLPLTIVDPGHSHGPPGGAGGYFADTGGGSLAQPGGIRYNLVINTPNATTGISGSVKTGGTAAPVTTVPPGIVGGIWLVKT